MLQELSEPTDKRMFVLAAALKAGYTIERLYELTNIDPWFLKKMASIVALQTKMETSDKLTLPMLIEAKKMGFSDKQIAACVSSTELNIRERRTQGILLHFESLRIQIVIIICYDHSFPHFWTMGEADRHSICRMACYYQLSLSYIQWQFS
jgi:hypothetical protein